MADGGLSTDQGQRVNPDGTVYYDFSDAHVSADGVDLKAGTDSSPPADRKIRWLRTTDGAVVAELEAYEEVAQGRFMHLKTLSDGDGTAASRIWGENDNGRAYLEAQEGFYGRCVAVADGEGAVILDGTGYSDFARVADGVAFLRITWGDGRAVITDGVSEVSDEITHVLGVVPASVTATAIVTEDGRDDYVVTLNSADDTTLYFNVRAAAGEDFPLADPTEVHFYWQAVAPPA